MKHRQSNIGHLAVYLDPVARGSKDWPASTLVDGIPDIENIGEALVNGPYGRCVYESPNDVVDHQVRTLSVQPETNAHF
jgi:hypothetical protein